MLKANTMITSKAGFKMMFSKMVAKLAVATSVSIAAFQPVSADVKDAVEAYARGEFEKAVAEWRSRRH